MSETAYENENQLFMQRSQLHSHMWTMNVAIENWKTPARNLFLDEADTKTLCAKFYLRKHSFDGASHFKTLLTANLDMILKKFPNAYILQSSLGEKKMLQCWELEWKNRMEKCCLVGHLLYSVIYCKWTKKTKKRNQQWKRKQKMFVRWILHTWKSEATAVEILAHNRIE